jgi:catecholate siderophore receptor
MPSSLGMTALMLAPTAFAADAPAPPPETVVVTGQQEVKLSSPKQTKPLLDTPQTVTVVPAAVIQQQGAASLLDVFKNSPGISMLAGEGGSGGAPGDSLNIRGFNNRKDIFVDGVRDFGSYSRDPFNLEQVELVKGPSSVLGGRGSTGGTVNLVTKQAQKDSFYAGTVSAGTHAYQRLTLDVNQSLEDSLKGAALRINAMGFSGNAPGRDYARNQRTGINPTMSFGLGSPTQVQVGLFYITQHNQPDFGLPFVPLSNNAVPGLVGYGNQVAPVPYSNYYGLIYRDHENLSTKIGSLVVKHDFGGGMVFSNRTQTGRTYRDSIFSAPRFSNAATSGVNHEFQSLDETDTNTTNQSDLTIKFATGTVRHTVVTGAEFSRERSLNYARGAYAPGTSPATAAPLAAAAFPTTDFLNPDPFQPYSYSVQRTGAYTDTIGHSAALYVFDTVDVDEQWSVMGGLRWDRFKADATSVSTTFTRNVLTNLSRTDNMTSWRGSVSYKPAANGNIYFSAGTSLNPSAEGLTLASTATATNSANLGPEKSISYEVGTKWNLYRDKLLVSAALFRTTKTNARTVNPAVPTDVITLDGEQRVQGVEFSVTGKVTDAWSLIAGYAYLDGKIVSSKNPLEAGQPLSSAPKHSANLWTVYTFPFNVDIGGGASYVDKRVVNTTATRYVDGYVVFDAMAAWRVNNRFSLNLNVYNLADKKYILESYNTGSSGNVLPGSARSAVVSGSFRF